MATHEQRRVARRMVDAIAEVNAALAEAASVDLHVEFTPAVVGRISGIKLTCCESRERVDPLPPSEHGDD
ncbi:hypothetical protein [Rhodoplanes elegans]|uniref:hypothetical protein n=1 Tax=Rhodoplanes elegans TaxID=29408 RepID=UPI0011B949F8|nr:hypothetical protein [Rhodoplanes elegans]